MAFQLHRAERTDLLADGLGALLSRPLPDPFARELVIVPAKGVERWLSQHLSRILGRADGTDGVCAGIAFRSPHSLVAEITGTTEDDPWSPDAMVWPLLDAIDASLAEPWCATLATHLGECHDGTERELRRGRRYAVARRLAGLFASYARQRPQLLVDWSAGGDGGVDADQAWQAALWRALTARVDAEAPHVRHAGVVARLTESPADLPERLSLFGHTRLAVTEIELLVALATHHDLHLWLPHPSDALWRRLAGRNGPVARRADDSHRAVGHPLLATLGRDLRELQRALPEVAADAHHAGGQHPDTLLGWLQSDLAADALRPDGRRIAADDRSVQVHSCHGTARQVDVLREVLLGLLADDPTLEPRDILVMCPDIETYAPLIVAGFGLGDVVHGAHPAHRLRVKLADRALMQTNPLLGVASQLLALAGGRATATEVLNLAEAPPVRARFGFTDDDLDAIGDWVREANIRWGFDVEHRKPYGVGFIQNTWRFGIDRVLAGVAMSDDSHAWLDTTLPLDDVGSNRVELAGRFAEYVDRLHGVVGSLGRTQPLTGWLRALADGIEALTAVDDADAWQRSQVDREFATVLAAAGPRAETRLRLSDVKAMLGRHLAGRPTRANFRTGTLTVCTMVPMRSVPHRVVCLVGLDDGVFPRLGVVDGDDVLARDPVTGERDIRSEDRQLLLDAIGAATERLVITYTGANEFSGQRRPPAVPLTELLDALDATTPERVRDRVLIEHPLQPFDVRNVTPGALGNPAQPFTFDTTALTAARTAAGQRIPRPRLLDRPLPAPPPGDVSLDDLLDFFKDPVKGFFRALDYTLPWDVDTVDDAMPVAVDNLQQWQIGDRMLDDLLRGMTPEAAREVEWRRGSLPPGRLGWRQAGEICRRAAGLAAAAQAHRRSSPRAYDVDIDLGAGRRLTGTVPRVFGERLVEVTYSKLDGKHLLAPWIQLLALAAAHPRRDWSAVCIGRPRHGETPRERRLGRPAEPATELLRDLVAIHDAGRCEPIPLPLKTSYTWAAAREERRDPLLDAGYAWNSGKYPGDNEQPAHAEAWGVGAPLDVLLGPVRSGEEYGGETTRLGAYAARLWLPLLRAEQDA
ncbi:exodeoxyribonuclease V subunit gamma [Mycobacterium sp. MYCO198283]|uniref:exodeoxyribonuclease V subunit gamma n=1 Tax=Mycobacterium sp. MYCO198283 TaxID=2883505 RepID=UPI001E63F4A5|nr:exodeoxyribonuclease V subunit gamma [Mycobacterium sp. MYCO198283]MCG5431942.1 exodeoxyribonuclease V subunit gamma [Mycobacterium sp. MYCO198283]